MMRLISISFLALSMCACATTKTANVLENVEVRAAEIVDKDVFNVEETHKQADKFYAAGDFKNAIAAYEKTLLGADEAYESRRDVLLGYADSALALASSSADFQNRSAKAYRKLSEIEDLSETHKNRILSGRVLLEIAAGISDDVEVRLNEALEENLDDPRLWNALGHFHDRAGEWVIATETYVKAMEAANDYSFPMAPIINNMGMSYLMRGRSKDALKKFEQAYEMNPDIGIYDNNRRLALVMTGRMDKAVHGLPDRRAAQIYNDAGVLSAQKGQTIRARSYYKKAIELSPVYFEKAEKNLLALAEIKTAPSET